MATGPPSVVEDLDRRLTDAEYWQNRSWRWVQEMHRDWGNEIANKVLLRWIRDLQGNESHMKQKVMELEVTREILEEVKEWNQQKSQEIEGLKCEIQALKGDVAALKATKAMKAWPVKPFVLTSFGLSDLSSQEWCFFAKFHFDLIFN